MKVEAVCLMADGRVEEEYQPRRLTAIHFAMGWYLAYQDVEISVWVKKPPQVDGVYMWISLR